MQSSDAELMARVVSDDPTAFTELDDRYRPTVYGYCLRKIGNAADADDLAQTTMFKAWQKRRLFNPKCGSIAAWILRIAANLMIDTARSRNRIMRGGGIAHDCIDSHEIQDDAVDQSHRLEIQREISAAVNNLPRKLKKTCKLKLDSNTVAEISDSCGFSRGTTLRRLRDAKDVLRQNHRLFRLAQMDPVE